VGVYTGRPNASETDPSGDGRGSFLIKRAIRTSKPLTVQYYVAGLSSAKNGVDFQTLTGTITIPARKYGAVVHIIPIDDGLDEQNKLVSIAVKPGAGYAIGHRRASLNVLDNDELDWFGDSRRYRTSFSFNSGSFARSDQPIDRAINFTAVLSGLSASGSLIVNSIRVVETDAAGTAQLDAAVPFQFDQDSNYNASSNASGNLVVLAKGTTAAGATRHYQVYFDTTGSYSALSFAPLVTTTDGVSDEGFSSVRIETETADYYYHKAEGGFSSILDNNGNDWVNWSSTPEAAGEFRGIPNIGPAGFHPGRDHDVTTTIVSQGPLKTVLESTDGDDNKVRWEFYPKFARFTVLEVNQNYYVLYEGTPGGAVDGNDTVTRSSGTTTAITQEWQETSGLNASGEEWVYFRDSAVNGGNGRFLYLVHNSPDAIRDEYYNLTINGNMTVFGFGRRNNPGAGPDLLLTAENNVFTLGLADGGGSFDAAAGIIKGAYRDVTVNTGGSEAKP
jgi:hypothetical protein